MTRRHAEIFCCYAREDQSLLLKLRTHLTPLLREKLITIWADTDIDAGMQWEKEIDLHLNTAQIILLLISPDFMNSDYCYSSEMVRALERHKNGEAYVIPIILRPVYWQGAPFAKLQALPTDGIPLTDRKWLSMDEAFFNVVEGIRVVCEELLTDSKPFLPITSEPVISSQSPVYAYQLYEVFVKSGVPNITFVERDDFMRLKLALAQPGRGVIIEGPSGVGKTTSLKKAIESLTST